MIFYGLGNRAQEGTFNSIEFMYIVVELLDLLSQCIHA